MQQLLFAQEYEDCNYLWLYVSQSLWFKSIAWNSLLQHFSTLILCGD